MGVPAAHRPEADERIAAVVAEVERTGWAAQLTGGVALTDVREAKAG